MALPIILDPLPPVEVLEKLQRQGLLPPGFYLPITPERNPEYFVEEVDWDAEMREMEEWY